MWPSERALYSMECAFHPLFSLTSGTCRLDYRRPENRWVSWMTGVSRCIRAVTGCAYLCRCRWNGAGACPRGVPPAGSHQRISVCLPLERRRAQGQMDWASLGLHLSLLEVSLISHFIFMGSVVVFPRIFGQRDLHPVSLECSGMLCGQPCVPFPKSLSCLNSA